MNNAERTTLAFLAGLGIGAVFAALITPRLSKEMRDGLPIRRNRSLGCCDAKVAGR